MRRKLLAGSVALVVMLGLAFAQEEEVLRVDVDLVNLVFSARDKKGALIPDLAKDEMTVFEDGKQQKIKDFVRETNLPLTIGLLVDVSGSQVDLIDVEKSAAAQFFSKVLQKKD